MSECQQSRRTFLKVAGMASVAAAFGTTAIAQAAGDALRSSARSEAAPRFPSIGLQLYTIRKEIEKDFDGTIRKVADAGFAGIETYALPPNVVLEHAAGIFKDKGLKVLGMHVELPVGKDREAALRLADAYQCSRVIYPGWPEAEKYKDLEAMKHMVEVYNETATFLKNRGLQFGLHNHWWEFEKHDGVLPFYYLLKNLDKQVFFEIDTYWAKTGGQDPAKVVHDFGKRAPLLHIKDGPAIKGEKSYEQVPAGEGAMDFPAIARAGKGNVEWMIVEFDEYNGDIFQGIEKSFKYLTEKKLGKGSIGGQ